MERKKIIILSDSPTLHTGFARVLREIWIPLHATGKYEIYCVGLFHPKDAKPSPFPVFATNKDSEGKFIHEDKFGRHSFSKYIEQIKPDLVWSCADITMIHYIQGVKNRDSFKWIGYFPIDGEPLPSNWAPVIEDMDVAVAYGKYGMNVVQSKTKKANLTYIYHGVNPEIFRPLSEAQKREAKKELGVDPSKIIIGIVARTGSRKGFDKLFEAYSYLLHGSYLQCNVCMKISTYPHDLINKTFSPLSSCAHCHSKDCKKGVPRDDIRLYIHGVTSDYGWDFVDLERDYSLKDKIYLNRSLKMGFCFSEEKLSEVYNIFDIFTLPTRGEGFGLPILEAMSAGVPVVVTDYSAYPEWAKGCGELVPPITFDADLITNIRRAVINMNEYVESLLKLIDDPKLRKEYGAKGREVALRMDWERICLQWENLVDETLLGKDNLN